MKKTGKSSPALLHTHAGGVTDLDFSSFHPNLVVTGGEDTHVKLNRNMYECYIAGERLECCKLGAKVYVIGAYEASGSRHDASYGRQCMI